MAFSSGGVQEFIQPGMGAVVDGISVRQVEQVMRKIMQGSLKVDKSILLERANEFTSKTQIHIWEEIMLNNLG